MQQKWHHHWCYSSGWGGTKITVWYRAGTRLMPWNGARAKDTAQYGSGAEAMILTGPGAGTRVAALNQKLSQTHGLTVDRSWRHGSKVATSHWTGNRAEITAQEAKVEWAKAEVVNQAGTKGKVATEHQSRDKDVDGEVAKVTAWHRTEAEAVAQMRAVIASSQG